MCPEYLVRALTWLRGHHSDYSEAEICWENLRSYPEQEPPVAWYYKKTDGKIESQNLAVNESNSARGVDDELVVDGDDRLISAPRQVGLAVADRPQPFHMGCGRG